MQYSKEDLAAIDDAKLQTDLAKKETTEVKKKRKNANSTANDKNMIMGQYEKTGEKPQTHNLLGNKTTKFIFDLCLGQ